jgi:hypothetical protein
MAARHNEPKPVDPLWYRSSHSIRIVCSCGRQPIEQRLDIFATLRRLDTRIKLGDLIQRLVCRECGARPSAEIVDRMIR